MRPAIAPDGRERRFLSKFVLDVGCPEGFAILDCDGVVRLANPTPSSTSSRPDRKRGRRQERQTLVHHPVAGTQACHPRSRQAIWRRARHADELEGARGAKSEIEISAVGDQDDSPRHFALDRSRRPSSPQLRDSSARARGRRGGPSAKPRSRGRSGRESRQSSGSGSLTLSTTTGGNRSAAAKTLEISRQSLYTKLKKYRLQPS